MSTTDTTRNASKQVENIYRSFDGSKKVEMALEMFETAKQITIAGISMRSPEKSRAQLERDFFKTLHGEDLTAKIFDGR